MPFGALIGFLPSSHIQKETTSKIAPNTIPGIFIGYYEDINGLSKDYVVISLALLGDVKAYPNDRTSWRLTPQRVGTFDFNTQREPQIPFKPAYDVRRESILIQEPATGRDISVWGGEPTLFDCPKDTPLVELPTTNWGRVLPRYSHIISKQH